MVKRKQKGPTLEDVLARPWCYYCERDFDDLKVLSDHQKAKHFKCDRCGRRLNTIGGLVVHMRQVHKEEHKTIENCIPGRDDTTLEIFGMEGIPHETSESHRQAIIQKFCQDAEARRIATGNPPPGEKSGNQPNKKPKLETAEEMKERLRQHLARKKNGSAGASPSPAPSAQGASPAPPVRLPGVSPPVQGGPQIQTPFQESHQPALPQVAQFSTPQNPSGITHQAEQVSHPTAPPSQPGYNNGSVLYPHLPWPQSHGFEPNGRPVPQPGTYGQPNAYSAPVQAPSYSPHGQMSPFSPHGQHLPHHPQQSQFPAAVNTHHHNKPSVGSRNSQTDSRSNSLPGVPAGSGLPQAPGLPQRPNFNPPAMSKEDMGRLHNGGHAPPGHAPHVPLPQHRSPQPQVATTVTKDDKSFTPPATTIGQVPSQPQPDHIDELISSATIAAADGLPATASPAPIETNDTSAAGAFASKKEDPVPSETATPAIAGKKEKQGKKEKKKDSGRLAVTLRNSWTEEARAITAKYTFKRAELDRHINQVVLDVAGGAVTGTVRGEDSSAKDAQDV